MPAKQKTVIPEGAKKPQDRAAKAEARGEDITVEHNGATYTIEAGVFDDVEMLELIGDLEDGQNLLLLPRVVRKAIGVEQWAAFKDANRDDKGRVPPSVLEGFFEALDGAVGNS